MKPYNSFEDKEYIDSLLQTSSMNLDILKQREQLMEDIDGICDEFFCEHFPDSKEQFDDLVRVLCDAVCKNFPTK